MGYVCSSYHHRVNYSGTHMTNSQLFQNRPYKEELHILNIWVFDLVEDIISRGTDNYSFQTSKLNIRIRGQEILGD